MKFSFEIVPRSLPAFTEQYEFLQTLGTAINVINVPDIQRFAIRSWELGSQIDNKLYSFVPHFRAIDFKIDGGDLFRIIEENSLEQVLLVSGDPPEGLRREFYNTDVVDLIAAVKRRFPSLKVFAGFDPHRQGLQDECNYTKRKVDAGADGFFSQPFYDIRMIDIYIDHMQGLDTYIGLSPITSLASMNYWQVKNKVQFPREFRPDYAWNIEFANRVIETACAAGLNIYFMPIRIDLQQYFNGLKFPGK